MAHYFCKGSGLEVGAMCYPYLFNSDCKMKYADIFDNNELRRLYDEIPLENLYSEDLVRTDYVLKAPKYLFEVIESNTFDFVYSSHSLEHTPNPISALNDQIRITKPGGIIYSVIPNKKNTYDRLRKTTPPSILINKFEKNIYEHSIDEAIDVVKNTDSHAIYEPYKKNPLNFAKEIIRKKEGIHHFHTFDETNTLEILIYLVKKNSAYIEYFSGFQERDIHFALRKKNSI